MYKNKKKCKKGGRVLASGGYGCVFTPALKCHGSTKRKKDFISKLMTERHALQEYDEITQLKNKLETIDDYKDYFLINDISVCKPSKLTSDDLDNFSEECSALPKDGITHKNINDSLDKIMALNMPNGGMPIDDYIYNDGSFEKLYKLNKSLIDLFISGILPMNHKHIYHCDIKDSNILVDDNPIEMKTRLIDWGLSTEYIPFKDAPFPKTWRNRPLQYNVPFSVIIFSDVFVKKYTEYITGGGETDENSLRPFVVDYIHLWMKERGTGHYKLINKIMEIFFGREITSISGREKEKVIEDDFTMTYITNYIIEILIHFTRFREDGSLNLRDYLDTVFIHIVDIWGFLISYYPLLDFLNDNYDDLSDEQMEMFDIIKNLFITYLYSPRVTPIDHYEIVSELKKLSGLLKAEITTDSASGVKKKMKNIKKKKGITGKSFIPKSRKNSKLDFKRNKKNKKTKTQKTQKRQKTQKDKK